MTSFLLRVLTPQGRTLRITVQSYEVVDGILYFDDPLTRTRKGFDARNVEIEKEAS